MKTNGSRIRLVILFSFLLCLLFVYPASSHDPITTTVTFNKEVVRILQKNCLGCHSPGRIKEDIPLTTFDEARPWAKAIKEEILERRMPPYQAVKGFGNFHNDYLLPQRDIELIVSWVEGGAPRGEDKDYPKDITSQNLWAFGKPDLIVSPPTPINIPAGEGESNQCLTIPVKIEATKWVNAIDFHPTGKNIFSAEFFISNQRSAACPAPSSLIKIGDWVPGQSAIKLPDHTGFLLAPNSFLTVKIRYQKGAEAISDQSSVGLYFGTREAEKKLQVIEIAPNPISVPAGAQNYQVKISKQITENFEVVAIRPLLFPLARSIEVTAYRPDGSVEILLAAKNFRFDWEPGFYLKNPVELPAGSQIVVTAYLDNSENNRNLTRTPTRLKLTFPLCELTLAKMVKSNSDSNSSAGH